MPGHDIVVIGASAGGVDPLKSLVGSIPAGLPATVFVVIHLPAGARSMLPEILSRSGPLPASHARDQEPFEQGHIFVAPPGVHLLLEAGHMRVVRGPHHNRHRPAIDPLFRSASRTYGPRVVGVVLSGSLDDGTAGLLTIKKRGGIAVVQDPADALFSGMPESALAQVSIDYRLPPSGIGALIGRLACEPASTEVPPHDERLSQEFESYMGDVIDMSRIGKPAVYACPECHGTLWEFDEDGVLEFRCRVGHSYTAGNLLAEHDGALESALWAARRALEENAGLKRRVAKHLRGHRNPRLAEKLDERAVESEHHAGVLRDLLLKTGGPPSGEPQVPS